MDNETMKYMEKLYDVHKLIIDRMFLIEIICNQYVN